ncbi:hypothetical protein [Amycolatopsis albispora]|uniref:Abortive infection protein n=1 Tax=Amycolatopsis albispora TaxID=1804986 RepID=A0A344LEU1_9PSEU|nr:hypothetical protein [Amycolatopsis albispora]AXB46565.1 hypothetical protein A4R43_32350 [Amycolatopsis albispora]
MDIRGISYTVGERDPAEDLRVIREELHCTTVLLAGTDSAAQLAAAERALDLGLDVWLEPQLGDRPFDEVLAWIAETATGAEALRKRYPGRVTLVVGCEYSLRLSGMLPGPREFIRLQVLIRWRRLFDRRITRVLNRLLARSVAVARGAFHGPITYAAGYWEQVDWSPFDLVGVNLYRMGADPAAYERRLRELVQCTSKPVVITEFGCGAFTGADRRGPASFLIVNWFATPPRIRKGHRRDEHTQAAYLGELIDLYERAGVHGAFVFTYWMPDFPHHPDDPEHDLDMAGFGVVKVTADGTHHPKAAFTEVAHRYSATTAS